MKNSQEPSLMGLPGELRSIIYRMTLISEDRIELDTTSKNWSGVPLQFLQVCRQIRTEAWDIFWCENRFQVTCIDQHAMPKNDCLLRMGRKTARLIEDIALKVSDDRDNTAELTRFRNLAYFKVQSLVLSHRIQIREEGRNLLYCGIPETSVKLFSPTLANCSLKDLELAQAAINKQAEQYTRNGRVLQHPVPSLRCSESGHHELRLGGLRLLITDADSSA